MKNIPLKELFSIVRTTRNNLWPELTYSISVSRMEVGLSSDYSSATRFVGKAKEARKKVIDYLEKERGYIVMKLFGGLVIAVLPHPTEDYVMSSVRFDTSEDTGTLVTNGDKAEGEVVREWFTVQYSQIGSVITTIDGFSDRGMLEKTIKYIPQGSVQLAHQSFYPWLSIPLQEYYDAFMKSDESVLVLFGPPGTGKSTFLRSLIAHGDQKAWLAYNKQVVESAKTVNHFFQSSASILAYEDIDNHLGSRENGNTLMATILNASEGILQHPGKKIVFSTNLPSIDRIDSALLRVGRCFDILKFEMLSREEATNVRTELKMDERDFSEKDKWPLAEVLAKHSVAQQTINRFGRKIGF